MDIALKVKDDYDMTLQHLGFNPYSDGYCSESRRKGNGEMFFWMFQSLFWWILLWKQTKDPAYFISVRVSILILMDIALKDLHCWCLLFLHSRFQSLFWWILLWKRWKTAFFLRDPIVSILILMDIALKEYSKKSNIFFIFCFNPYSDGYCSESNLTLIIRFRLGKFQSLFWWILLWKNHVFINSVLCFRVSILILMDIALKA